MSSFYLNEPNVAYNDTSSDLTFGTAPYLKNGCDMTLFGLDAETFDNNNMFTNFGSTEQNMPTVSPQQLSMPMMGSVPSTSTIPELSPSNSDFYSPALSDNLDSPLFTSNSVDTSPYLADNMAYPAMSNYPLFPSQETSAFEVPAAQEPAPAVSDARKRSLGTASATASPIMGARPAGIRKKSIKPLAPIVIDESDPAAAKRQRNTAAARRSRAKKNEHVEELEAKIVQLQAELAAANEKLARIDAQNSTNPTQQQNSFDDDLARLLGNTS